MSARRRVLGVLAVAAVALAVLPGAPSADAGPASSAVTVAAAGGYTRTKTVSRDVLDVNGNPDAGLSSSYDMTVRADRTTDLRGRERVHISWSGARPSAGRASNPYGEKGLLQEYPVVIMQCRGRDDADLPLKDRVRPETCWTSSVAQRSQRLTSRAESTWLADRYADPADRQPVSGIDPFPADACKGLDSPVANTHLTAFVAKSGKSYPACAADKMPPEAGIDAAFPPSELAAFTDPEGNGSVQFEVRSDVENESLGCSDKVACSIVVVPILGISLRQAGRHHADLDRPRLPQGRPASGGLQQLRRRGRRPGRLAVAVVVGVQLAQPLQHPGHLRPAGRRVRHPRPARAHQVLRLRLMAQAALQWAPAYCLRKDRFNFALSQMPDNAGWENMEGGSGPAAFVSSEHAQARRRPRRVRPDRDHRLQRRLHHRPARQRRRVRPAAAQRTPDRQVCSPRAYLGSDLGRGHPGMSGNPLALMSDPEFVSLNKGLSQNAQEAGATLLSLSVSSDLIRQITAYIAQDADAMDFIAGKPDPWGMKINPSYQGLESPRDEWPLLDTYVPQTQNECLKQNPTVYFTQSRLAGLDAAHDRGRAHRLLAERADPLRLRHRDRDVQAWAARTARTTAPASCSAW
ncbi:hypothetical protein G5V59_10165 [Nocardioides sp. W3-2-3]|uniref:hypothetical protein n=1 Tax=Nocardioides convexus TaxID=2712224 RepID=UPI002418A8BD|nr:hypothetical protein [Nocardioides convexus]NHA00352.1 hypothetical protein [Nocardioides convexus]